MIAATLSPTIAPAVTPGAIEPPVGGAVAPFDAVLASLAPPPPVARPASMLPEPAAPHEDGAAPAGSDPGDGEDKTADAAPPVPAMTDAGVPVPPPIAMPVAPAPPPMSGTPRGAGLVSVAMDGGSRGPVNGFAPVAQPAVASMAARRPVTDPAPLPSADPSPSAAGAEPAPAPAAPLAQRARPVLVSVVGEPVPSAEPAVAADILPVETLPPVEPRTAKPAPPAGLAAAAAPTISVGSEATMAAPASDTSDMRGVRFAAPAAAPAPADAVAMRAEAPIAVSADRAGRAQAAIPPVTAPTVRIVDTPPPIDGAQERGDIPAAAVAVDRGLPLPVVVDRGTDGITLAALPAASTDAPPVASAPADAPAAAPATPVRRASDAAVTRAADLRSVFVGAATAAVVRAPAPAGSAADGAEPATAGLDLAAIFPLAGSAPLTVAFVRPPPASVPQGVAGLVTPRVAGPVAAVDASAREAKAADGVPLVDAAQPASLVAPTPALAPAVSANTDAALAPAAPAISAEVSVQHHLDVAHDGVWLDRLARDIAASADHESRMRFQLNPERLGALTVEIRPGTDGASVRFTADSEAARTLIADAQPKLIADARAHGMTIADTQVDVSGRQSGGYGQGGAGGFAQQQQQQSGGQRSPLFDRPAAAMARPAPARQADQSAARAERYA